MKKKNLTPVFVVAALAFLIGGGTWYINGIYLPERQLAKAQALQTEPEQVASTTDHDYTINANGNANDADDNDAEGNTQSDNPTSYDYNKAFTDALSSQASDHAAPAAADNTSSSVSVQVDPTTGTEIVQRDWSQPSGGQSSTPGSNGQQPNTGAGGGEIPTDSSGTYSEDHPSSSGPAVPSVPSDHTTPGAKTSTPTSSGGNNGSNSNGGNGNTGSGSQPSSSSTPPSSQPSSGGSNPTASQPGSSNDPSASSQPSSSSTPSSSQPSSSTPAQFSTRVVDGQTQVWIDGWGWIPAAQGDGSNTQEQGSNAGEGYYGTPEPNANF